MVVTRKIPTAPAPVTSRASSSQPQARSQKQKSNLTVLADDTEPSKSSAKEIDTQPKSGKHKNKHKKKSRNRKPRNTWLDFLTKFFILAFTIYTVTVCPSPDSIEKVPLCRALDTYRRLVVEPLLLPPLRLAVNHPAVQPYIEKATPFYERAATVVIPAAQRVHSTWTKSVIPQWNKHVVPRWKALVLPLWRKHVLTHWNIHVAPRVAEAEAAISPYTTAATKAYTERIEPRMIRFYYFSKPYVLRAAAASRDAYFKALPYVLPAWNRVIAEFLRGLAFLQAQRRTYVDPQVVKIWDKVLELSTRRTPTDGTYTAQVMPTPTSTPSPVPSQDEQSRRLNAEEKSAENKQLKGTVSGKSSDMIPETEKPVPKATSSQVPSEAIPTIQVSKETPTAKAAAEPSPEAFASVFTEQTTGDHDFDHDNFIADLGLDLDEEEPQVTSSAPPPVPTKSEEEEAAENAERLRRTAEKRASINKRHSEWEAMLNDEITKQRKNVRNKIINIRKAAAEELKKDKKIRSDIDTFLTECERLLKGVEVYLKKMQRDEETTGGDNAAAAKKWGRVVDKVADKFEVKVTAIEETVDAWFQAVSREELSVVEQAFRATKEIADAAQSDVGMDYAWLDDVTYEDWQRYHNLIRDAESLKEEGLQMQNGTHAQPLPNAVHDVLDDLNVELDEISDGFETRLRIIRRAGIRAFGSDPGGSPGNLDDSVSDDDGKAGINPVPDKVEILEPEPEPVVIGRGAKEVMDAMKRAEGRDKRVHEEL